MIIDVANCVAYQKTQKGTGPNRFRSDSPARFSARRSGMSLCVWWKTCTMTSYVENTGKYCHDKSSSFGDDGKKNPWMLGDGTAPPNQENEAVSAAGNIRACIKQHPRHLPIHYVFIIYIFTSSSILYICIICLFLSLSLCDSLYISYTDYTRI